MRSLLRSPGCNRVAMFVLNDVRLDSRVRREAASLAAAGWEVVVYGVLTEATASIPRERVEGYTIIRVPMLARPTGGAAISPTDGRQARPRTPVPRRLLVAVFDATRPLFGGSLHMLANWQLRWRSWGRRVAAQVEPADVWHAHDLNTLALAVDCKRRLGGMLVYDSHEIFTEAGAMSRLPALVRRLAGWAERRLVRDADAVITVNQTIAGVLAGHLGVPEVQVIHNCAEPPREDASPLRGAIRVASAVPIVLYHGALTAGRGLELLVSAMADERLRLAHLVFMGYGPELHRLRGLSMESSSGDRIHFLPPVPPREVTSWVSGADVAAMPIEPGTLNHRLCSPNKLFEALAAGVPVVGPRFVEFRRIIQDAPDGPLGRLHEDHSPQAIAEALHAILATPQHARAELRQRCRSAASKRWSWSIEADRLVATYARLRAAAPASAGSVPSGRGIVPAARRA
jgi:glycosyltransferase involved in cell wall biosynthesis